MPRKDKTRHFTLRLNQGNAAALPQITAATGWTESQAVNWLMNVGVEIITTTADLSAYHRDRWKAYKEHHAAKLKADAIIAQANKKIRGIERRTA